MTRKSGKHCVTRDIQNHWTAASTLLSLINSVYHDLSHWRSNQRSQNVKPKLYHWAMVHIAHKRSQINSTLRLCNQLTWCVLSVIFVLLQKTRSPLGLCLPKRNGDTHPRNYNLMGKERDIHFFIWRNHIINWITMSRKSGKHYAQHTEPLDSCFNLNRSHQQCIAKT